MTILFQRAKIVLKEKGLLTLVKRVFKFAARQVFFCETCYLYDYTPEYVRGLSEADLMPKIDNFTFKVVSSNKAASDLETNGFEFRSHVINARERLDKGAIAFCIFVGHEFANIGWVALNDEAMKSLAAPPFQVDFDKNESVTSSDMTNPKYRGLGLMPYNLFKRLEFLTDRGIVRDRAAVSKSNAAAVKASNKSGTRIYGEGCYLRILWWKFWKEKPH